MKTFPELSDDELDRYLAANVGAVSDLLAETRRARRRPRQPPGHGPCDPRPRRARVRDQGPWVRPLLHRPPAPRALRPVRPRGRRGCGRDPGRIAAHRRGSLGDGPELGAARSGRGSGPRGWTSRPSAGSRRAEARAHALELATRRRSARGSPTGQAMPSAATTRAPPPRCAGSRRAIGPRVLFVGKLLVNKGVDLLACRLAAGSREHPGARLLLVGFGAYREGLERLWAALEARRPRRRGRGRRGGAALEGEGEPGAAADPLRLPRGAAQRIRGGGA